MPKELSQNKVEVPNFGALSLWTKLVGDNRADYIKAFYALSQVKTLMTDTDIIQRYFIYNMYHWGYNSQEKVN